MNSDAPLPPPTSPASGSRPAEISKLKNSLNQDELKKFAEISEMWWDAEGPFKPLHEMNPTRLSFIKSTLCRHSGKDPNSRRPFEGLKFVDVGCGGGILSKPLARLGASVTGIDLMLWKRTSRLHSFMLIWNPVLQLLVIIAQQLLHVILILLEFCDCVIGPEKIGGEQKKFDAVIALELPTSTHQWSSFLTPEELALILERASVTVHAMAGFVYNPLTGRWFVSDDISVNFIAYGTKKNEQTS